MINNKVDLRCREDRKYLIRVRLREYSDSNLDQDYNQLMEEVNLLDGFISYYIILIKSKSSIIQYFSILWMNIAIVNGCLFYRNDYDFQRIKKQDQSEAERAEGGIMQRGD